MSLKELDVKVFQEQAEEVDQRDGYVAIRSRLQDNDKLLFNALRDCAIMANRIDAFKKVVAYGLDPESEKGREKLGKIDDKITHLENINEEKLDYKPLQDETFARLVHYYLGVFSEAGELIEALIAGIETGNMDLVNLREEHGDIFWYLARASRTIGSTFEHEMFLNNKKLNGERYAGGYSDNKAIDRRVDVEREILEEKK